MFLSLSSVNSFASEWGLRDFFPFLAAFTKYNILAILRSQSVGAGAAWVLTCGVVSPPQAAYPHSGGAGSRHSIWGSTFLPGCYFPVVSKVRINAPVSVFCDL